jgi:hypothetical protein
MLREGKEVGKGLKAEKFYFNNLFLDRNCPQYFAYDFAVLKLESNSVIKSYHILKMSFEFSLAESIGKEIMVCGYSGQRKEELYKQFYEERIPGPDEMVERDDGFLYYKHTTKKGNSGGPVFIKTASAEFKVVGVHKGWKYERNRCIMIKAIEKLNPTFQT